MYSKHNMTSFGDVCVFGTRSPSCRVGLLEVRLGMGLTLGWRAFITKVVP